MLLHSDERRQRRSSDPAREETKSQRSLRCGLMTSVFVEGEDKREGERETERWRERVRQRERERDLHLPACG